MKPFQTYFLLSLLFITSFGQAQDSIKKPGILFDISVGSSTRFGKKNPDQASQNYSEKLRTGISYEASLYFRVKNEANHFIGFKYNSFHKEAGIRGSYNPYAGIAIDKISLGFYGFGYMYNSTDDDGKNEWMVEGALGYMTYKDNAELQSKKYEITGSSVGISLAGAYYIKIYKSIHVGPKLSLFVGSVKELDITGLPGTSQIKPDLAESLTRFDAALSLRFKF